MEGVIFLDVNLFKKNMELNLNNYTYVKDALNAIDEKTLSFTHGWQGEAKDRYVSNMNDELCKLDENVDAIFKLLDEINTLGLELKRTQAEVISISGGV